MKKSFFLVLVFIMIAPLLFSSAYNKYSSDVIEKIRLSENEIPHGFAYGKIPEYAKKIFKDNPWVLDREAVKRLGGSIYPGGDYKSMESVHVTIMAKAGKLYRDDIVCFILIYKDSTIAKKEIQKLNDFISYNGDRAIALTHDNIAVYLHVDDIANYHLLKGISNTIDEKLKAL